MIENANSSALPGILHHPVVRGRRRHVRDLVVLKRLHQPHRIEATGECAGGDAERQRRQRAMPQAVPPGGRGRDRRTRRPDGCRCRTARQTSASRARDAGASPRPAIHASCRRCTGTRPDRRRGSPTHRWSGNRAISFSSAASATTTRTPIDLPGDFRLFGIRDQQLRLAVIDPQPQAVEPEQREQRHADRAHESSRRTGSDRKAAMARA